MHRIFTLLAVITVVATAQALNVFPDRQGQMPVETLRSLNLKGSIRSLLHTAGEISTSYTFNIEGCPVSYQRQVGLLSQETKSFMYGPDRRLISADIKFNKDGETIRCKYGSNDNGQLVTEQYYTKDGGLMQTTSYTYTNGFITTKIETNTNDAGGAHHKCIRDQYGNITSTIIRVGGKEILLSAATYNYTTNTVIEGNQEFLYSDDGLVARITVWSDAKRTGDPIRVETLTYTFDSTGNWIKCIRTIKHKGELIKTDIETRKITYQPAKL